MKTLVALIGVVMVGMALFESTMQPSARERNELLALFLAMAVVTAVAAWVLPRLAERSRSLRTTVVALAVSATLLVGLVVAVAAWRMFFSGHDLNLLLVVLGFGAGLGVVFALAVAGRDAADLAAIRQAAQRVAAGDLEARTGVARHDEVGEAAAALDDMAGRLAAAEQARLADERARRAFLAAVGHDLRTPLAALQAAVEALEDGMASEPERFFQAMHRDLAALRALVDDLFLLARIEAGDVDFERVPIDLAELADEAIEALSPVASRRDVGLRLEAPGRVAAVGGPEALSRVIRNLVDNAIRFAPQATDVVVQVGNGRGPLVRVVDEGPGFPADMLETAFDSSVRADPSRARATGGNGLGLAIARGVVQAHGGEIWAEAGPGGAVAFRLPSP